METRAEISLPRRALRIALALMMALYFAPGLLLPQRAWADEGSALSGGAITVSDLSGLQSAVNNSSVNTIIVSTTIALPDETTIDGNGKTIQVPTPYADASGACPSSGAGDSSSWSVFAVTGDVTLKNMTVYGGYQTTSTAGGITVSSGTLRAENVTIARSFRGLYVGSSTKASLTNCNVVRNVCGYGAGIVCYGGVLVMDGCSLSENRSTSQGGGAIEVKNSGEFYANNTVIANNCSAEIGGAVNNYKSDVYLMNCTVTGNVTTHSTYGAKAGGGIGLNLDSDDCFYAVNSIFMDNKYILSGTGTPEPSDIGLYSGCTAGNAKLSHCLYGTVSGSTTITTDACNQNNDSSNVFASYRNDGILRGASGSTTNFSHPALISKSSAYALYAPLMSGDSNPAASGGTTTYFDKGNLSDVEMAYGRDNAKTIVCGNEVASAAVATYYEGGVRTGGTIGASNQLTAGSSLYTVRLSSAPINGDVSGVSLQGDGKKAGDTVMFTVTPAVGYEISAVTAKQGNGSSTVALTSSGSTYSFAMPACDVTVSVTFVATSSQTYTVKLSKAPENGSVTEIGINKTVKAKDSTVTFAAIPNPGYAVASVAAAKDGDATEAVTVNNGGNGNYSFAMPSYNVVVSVSFTQVTHKVKLFVEPANGTVSGITTVGVDKGVNSTVSFVVTPNGGYKVKSVTVAKTDDSSTTVDVIGPDTNNTYTFTMPDYDVTVTVEFEQVSSPAPPAPTPTPSTPSYVPDPAPSGVTASGATDASNSDGAISGVTSDMEYKLEGTDEWTPVASGMTEVKNLPAGTYLVRYRGSSTYTKITVAGAALYNIEVKASDLGTASASKKAAAKGELIELSAQPAKGYNLRGWVVNDELVEAGEFTMPASDVTVEPVFSPVKTLFIAKAKAYKGKAKLSWKSLPGAIEYKVYLAKPGKKLKKVATVADSAGKISCTAKKLKAGKVYRMRVAAIGEDGTELASSKIAYVTPKGGKRANASKVSATAGKIVLEIGQKAQLGAKVAKKDAKGKKLLKVSGVAKLRYASSEPAIAKVSKKGKVTALSAGTAYVYAIAADGVAKRVKVVVTAA